MKVIFKCSSALGIFSLSLLLLLLFFLCSCNTTRPPLALPADMPMNAEAGRGETADWVIAMVRVGDSQPLPFIVDTGCPVTCLDQSLEPKLGTCLARTTVVNFGVSHPAGAYEPPQLYLGNTPLRKSGDYVFTTDCRRLFEAAHVKVPFMGFLGMDVLKHYCVQLDFQSGQVRFLGDEHADTNAWGKPIHLSNIGDGCVSVSGNLAGTKGPPSMIDTGFDSDGNLVAKLFEQWTNHMTRPFVGEARSPNGVLDGERYQSLDLGCTSAADHDSHARFNVIGIHVLSENLVTFDFPKRTMYLKRTSDWPLISKQDEAQLVSAEKSALDVLVSLGKRDQLPGWHEHVWGSLTAAHYSPASTDSVTLDIQKKGDPALNHYTFSRISPTSPWDLKKAWQTDKVGQTVKEFSMP